MAAIDLFTQDAAARVLHDHDHVRRSVGHREPGSFEPEERRVLLVCRYHNHRCLQETRALRQLLAFGGQESTSEPLNVIHVERGVDRALGIMETGCSQYHVRHIARPCFNGRAPSPGWSSNCGTLTFSTLSVWQQMSPGHSMHVQLRARRTSVIFASGDGGVACGFNDPADFDFEGQASPSDLPLNAPLVAPDQTKPRCCSCHHGVTSVGATHDMKS